MNDLFHFPVCHGLGERCLTALCITGLINDVLLSRVSQSAFRMYHFLLFHTLDPWCLDSIFGTDWIQDALLPCEDGVDNKYVTPRVPHGWSRIYYFLMNHRVDQGHITWMFITGSLTSNFATGSVKVILLPCVTWVNPFHISSQLDTLSHLLAS